MFVLNLHGLIFCLLQIVYQCGAVTLLNHLLNPLLNYGAFDVVDAQKKLKHAFKNWLWVTDQILVSYDVLGHLHVTRANVDWCQDAYFA